MIEFEDDLPDFIYPLVDDMTDETLQETTEEPVVSEGDTNTITETASDGMDWIHMMEEAERTGEEFHSEAPDFLVSERKNGSTRSKYSGPKEAEPVKSFLKAGRTATNSSRTHKGKRRRRRRNPLPFIVAAVILLVILIGGGSILASFGIIGGKELYEVYINESLVGTVENSDMVRDHYLKIRREVAQASEDLVLMEADYDVKKIESFIKVPTEEAELLNNMKKALEESIVGTLDKSYAVKINDNIIHLGDKTEVVDFLETVVSPYDEKREFSVQLVTDTSRELSVLTTQMVRTESATDIGGMVDLAVTEEPSEEKNSDTLPQVIGDSDGLKEVDFVENIEIAEAYVSTELLTNVQDAAAEITKEKEESQIYEVVAGDSLSVVANNHGMKVAKLLELNEHLTEDSVLKIGDEIVITVPQPELSVITKEEVTYEEDYEAPVQYIDNDEWYTTKQVVKQEPVTGHHKVTAIVTRNNGKETDREIIAETVMSEAVPKIVERGTQTPPTYIKPLSGGTFTSGYKYRWGRWHRGVDWACPVGTTIFASCGGTVSSAGWSSSYGYVITIKHPDGRQTRYAHLSKILVSSGQKVKQGQKIALSGNTGRSTGPHLHFEIIINGSKVNPMKYLN